jgi:hypothetical protein
VASGRSFFSSLINFSFAQLLARWPSESGSTVHGGDPPALSAYQDGIWTGAAMRPKSLIKLIKKAQRESPPVKSETEFISDQNRWSRAVRAWVSDFQENARRESTPAFDRLFKDASL